MPTKKITPKEETIAKTLVEALQDEIDELETIALSDAEAEALGDEPEKELEEEEEELDADDFTGKAEFLPMPEIAEDFYTSHIVRYTNDMRVVRASAQGAGGAYHKYKISPMIEKQRNVQSDEDPRTQYIKFQEGPVQDNGVNGLQNEDLIAIVIDRLVAFQRGPFPCVENAIAIDNLLNALEILEARTEDRIARGVEGKSEA